MIDIYKNIAEENKKEDKINSIFIVMLEEFFFYKLPFKSLCLFFKELMFVFLGSFVFSV
jgi:hypothetical protein